MFMRVQNYTLSVPSASAGVDVNLATVEAVEAILRGAETPVTRYYVRRRLAEIGRGTTPARLNRALGYLVGHGLAVEGSKGLQWTSSGSASLRRAAATGRRL